MATNNSAGAPIPFITIDENDNGNEEGDKKFIVNEDALEALRNITTPVAVVAIAGLYRTGKSFLVNRIIGQQKGFQVGPTVEACTKGIWLWSQPIKGTTTQGEEVSLIVLDTEGLGGTDASDRHDSRVFALAVLLCSKLIYNSLGSIDEDAISNLSFVANLTQMIHVNSKKQKDDSMGEEEEEDIEELASFFPSFLWIVRDFALELLDEDGNEMSSKEYLERSLEQNDGFDEAEAERNHVRACLTSFFLKRDCTTLVRPLEDEQKLQTIDNENFDSLRPEFKKGMEGMRKRLLSTLPKKTVRGKSLTGPMLATLAKTYVSAMNNDGVPTISTAWEHVAENEAKEGLETAVEMYENAIDSFFKDNGPVPELQLFKKHEELKRTSIDYFSKRAVGNFDDTNSGINKVTSTAEKHFEEHIQIQNLQLSKTVCKGIISKLIAENIDAHLGTDDENTLDSTEKIDDAFKKIRQEYNVQAKGDIPEKANILASTLFTNYSRSVKFVQDQISKENDMLKEEVKLKESERVKLAVDLKHEKTVHEMDVKEAAMEKKRKEQEINKIKLEFNDKLEQEQKLKEKEIDTINKKIKESEASKQANKNEINQYEEKLKKMEMEIKRLEEMPKGGGCCVVM
jgi:hypothetical protein